MTITLLHFITKFLSFLLIAVVMQTYNIACILVIIIARTLGNLVFGMLQDTIVIRKVRREKKEIARRKAEALERKQPERKFSMESFKF